MGTSLSGLTPATTFDGLLKTSDNDAITSSLKTIGSGDGTDSCLQLSDSALKVNSGSVTIVGAGNTGATTSLLIEDSSAGRLLRVNDSGEIRMQTLDFLGNKITSLARINTSGLAINNAGTSPDANTQLHIKGSGATSATTSLLVQNSAGTELMKVNDNGAIDFSVLGIELSNDGSGGTISVADDRYVKIASSLNTYSALNAHVFKTFGNNAYSEVMRITGNTDQLVGIGETSPTAKLHVKVGTTQDSIAKFEDPRATTDYIEIKNDSVLTDYTGLYWGTAAKIRSKQTGAMFLDCTSGILFADGNSARSKIDANGNMSVGVATIPASTRMTIQGQGATSATTSLLVQNSDASASLTYDDSGKVEIVGNSQTGFIQTYGFGAVGFGNESGPTILYGNNLSGLHTNNGYTAFGANSSSSQRVLIKGSGATSATTSLLVQNSSGTEHLKITDDGVINARQSINVNHATNSSRYVNIGWGSIAANDTGSEFSIYGGGGISGSIMYLNGSTKGTSPQGIGMKTTGVLIAPSMVQSSFAPSAQLHVKGSGATSATTSLLVQNSAGDELFKLTDDGNINMGEAGAAPIISAAKNSGKSLKLGNQSHLSAFDLIQLKTWNGTSYTEAMRITGNTDQFVGIGETTPTAKLHVKGSGNDNTTTALLVQNSDGTDLFKVRDDGRVLVDEYIYPADGTTASRIRLSQSTGTRIYYSTGYLAVNPSLVYNSTTYGTVFSASSTTGDFSLNGATGAKMAIKGNGATSATTALLVENSSGTDTLEVRDDGRVVAGTGATTNANGTFNVLHGVSNLTTRVFTVSRDSVLRGMDINSGGSTKISDSSGDQSFSHTATAVLEVSSTTKGFLPPRMTGTQRDAIEEPASGLIIYNTTTNKAQCYNGTSWNDMF